MTTVTVKYLARLRETFGLSEERLMLTQATPTVADALALLRTRGKEWAFELGEGRAVRAAVNQTMATPATLLNNGDELAFFPPVTGG